MTSVLVVDDEEGLRRALARELRANGYESAAVGSYDEAMQQLAAESYDVLLTDLRMGDKDGLDLILALGQAYPATRPILMSAYATARDSERAKELGAVHVLCKPFETREMLDAVERAVESAQGFHGDVHGLQLVDMLQMFHYAQRSVSVHLLGSPHAAIHLDGGQIVHASVGALQGEDALSQILTLPQGVLQTSPLGTEERTIRREFQPLMLDLLRQLDERRRGSVAGEAGGEGDERQLESGAECDALAWLNDRGSDPPGRPERALAARREPGLLSDACRRIVAELSGDIVCAVIDVEHGRLLGCHATGGDVWRRSEALAAATLSVFRDAPVGGLAILLGGAAAGAEPGRGLRRVELALEGGVFFARTTRRGRRVLSLLLGRGGDARAARAQLDAVFPLVEALAP